VRLIKATCKIEFPTAPDRNFHGQVMERLARLHNLREVRKIDIPGKWIADRHGRTVLAEPAKP
jgi:hypothetical protein